MWEEFCRVNKVGPPGDECPFYWQRDPYVARVLSAFATGERLGALYPRMPAALARGLEFLSLVSRRVDAWSHEQMMERYKREGGGSDG